MRFLTPEQALARLQNSKNVMNVHYQDRSSSGTTGKELPRVTDEVRALSFAHAAAGLRTNEIASLFGLAPATVREIARGEKRSSGGNYVEDPKLGKLKEEVNETVSKKAVDLVLESLEVIKNQGLLKKDDNKLRDVTGAAKDLASVIEKFQPKQASGNTAAVILMGTLPYAEDRYKIINVEAKVG